MIVFRYSFLCDRDREYVRCDHCVRFLVNKRYTTYTTYTYIPHYYWLYSQDTKKESKPGLHELTNVICSLVLVYKLASIKACLPVLAVRTSFERVSGYFAKFFFAINNFFSHLFFGSLFPKCMHTVWLINFIILNWDCVYKDYSVNRKKWYFYWKVTVNVQVNLSGFFSTLNIDTRTKIFWSIQFGRIQCGMNSMNILKGANYATHFVI